MSLDEVEVDFLVVGAGVVGLAVAEAMTRHWPSARVVVVERHPRFGQETSSRNSEVIHAGLYYRGLPNKERTCVRGRELLEAYCAHQGVPYRRLGKLIVAVVPDQLPGLERLVTAAAVAGVPLERLTADEARRRARLPGAIAALWSPMTGIVDAHALMQSLEGQVAARDGLLLYATRVVAPDEDLGAQGRGLRLDLMGPDGSVTRVHAAHLVNAAGLGAARLTGALVPGSPYTVRPCRGRYFRLASRWNDWTGPLLYPLPDPAGGLGVHLTLDLAGNARLGPDVDWNIPEGTAPDDARLNAFDEDPALQTRFWEAGRKLLPDLREDELRPDCVGVRPKLFRSGDPHPDFAFVPSHEGRALHLLGIESPGLTAALAIAEEVVVTLGAGGSQ